MALDKRGARLVLIAPAWKAFGAAPSIPGDTVILHSPDDDVVPIEDSVELSELTGATLIECGICHRMSDADALSMLADFVGP